jgi:hypothetical protein
MDLDAHPNDFQPNDVLTVTIKYFKKYKKVLPDIMSLPVSRGNWE